MKTIKEQRLDITHWYKIHSPLGEFIGKRTSHLPLELQLQAAKDICNDFLENLAIQIDRDKEEGQ